VASEAVGAILVVVADLAAVVVAVAVSAAAVGADVEVEVANET
jgi:hypothetical protein